MGEIFYMDLGFILYWSLSSHAHLNGLTKSFVQGLNLLTNIRVGNLQTADKI